MSCLLLRSSWSSFLHFAKYPPWVLCPCYFMLQQLNGTQLICCRLQKNLVSGFSSNVTCWISAEEKGQQRRVCEYCVEPWSLFTSPLYVSFPVCRRAGSNDLPPLCRAPSAWPWAEAIWCLFVLVTSAPTGTWNYFSSLYWTPECEPVCLWILLYVGVWWVRETIL